MTLDAVDYKNKGKNQWRHRVWSSLRKTVIAPDKTIVLYLPGETDLDSFMALRSGFKRANLIAVERDSRVAEELRAKHRTVICDDLLSVMKNWPSHTPVGVVIADLQCGLEDYADHIALVWTGLEAFRNGTLLLNLQRGRERPDGETLPFIRSFASSVAPAWDENTNRAAFMILRLLGLAASRLGLKKETCTKDEWFKVVASAYAWRYLPSYRSTPRSPLFDSFVIRDLGRLARYSDLQCMNAYVEGSFFENEGGAETKRKIAAALAVRTMRLNGRLAVA